MSKTSLYNTQKPACAYCRYGIRKGDVVLCEYNGVVDTTYKCRKFRYDPIKRVPMSVPPLPDYSEEDFSID